MDRGRKKINSKPYHNYGTLLPGRIRLLQIHHAPDGQSKALDMNEEPDLMITLQEFSLSACPHFVALSYTWGEPTHEVDPRIIMFTTEARCYPIRNSDGSILRGTRNLRAALRHLYLARASYHRPQNDSSFATLMNREALYQYGSVDWFWVDALCIDQDDMVERANQVKLMRKIYQRAQVCVAWLGEADSHSQVTEQLIWDVSERRARVPPNERQKVQDSWNQMLSEKQYLSIQTTFARKWFTRIWILQEVLLAPQAVALWGQTSFILIPLLHMHEHILSVRTLRKLDESYDSSPFPSDVGTLLPSSSNALSNSMLLSSVTGLARVKAKLEESKILPSFYNILELSWQRQCMDPRDRIYGILGITQELLSESGKPVIKVDYNLPVETVYIQATAAVAHRGQDLQFLAFVCNPQSRNFVDLPSWCPDYSVTHMLPDFNHNGPSLWTSEPNIRVLDNKVLEVYGVPVGVVGQTYQLKNDHVCLASGIQKAVSLLQLAASMIQPDCVETLAKMLLMDQMDKRGPAKHAASIYLPLGLVNAMKVPDPDTESGFEAYYAEKDVGVMTTALEQLYEVATLLCQRSKSNVPFLPQIDLFREAFESTLQKGYSNSVEINCILDSIFQVENSSINARAHDAGLLRELCEQLGDEYSSNLHQQPHSTVAGLDPYKSEELPVFEESMLYRMEINLQGTTVFATQSHDRLGFGYRVNHGDELWVLQGSLAPVLLQKDLATGYYNFGEQLYISGAMRGELSQERDVWLGRSQRISII
jgi:hypothetical protein